VTSRPTALADLRIGYKFNEKARVWLDILNLFNNRTAHQIDYFYPSQLASESPGTPVNPWNIIDRLFGARALPAGPSHDRQHNRAATFGRIKRLMFTA
jgi:hypothetical protein